MKWRILVINLQLLHIFLKNCYKHCKLKWKVSDVSIKVGMLANTQHKIFFEYILDISQ